MTHEKLTPNKKPLKNNLHAKIAQESRRKAPSGPSLKGRGRGGAIEKEIIRQHGLCCAFKLSEVPHWITKEQNEAIWFHVGAATMARHPIAAATCDITRYSKYQRCNTLLEERTGLTGLLVLPMFLKYDEVDSCFSDIDNTYIALSRERPYLMSNVNIEALEIWDQIAASNVTEIVDKMCVPRLSIVSA